MYLFIRVNQAASPFFRINYGEKNRNIEWKQSDYRISGEVRDVLFLRRRVFFIHVVLSANAFRAKTKRQ